MIGATAFCVVATLQQNRAIIMNTCSAMALLQLPGLYQRSVIHPKSLRESHTFDSAFESSDFFFDFPHVTSARKQKTILIWWPPVEQQQQNILAKEKWFSGQKRNITRVIEAIKRSSWWITACFDLSFVLLAISASYNRKLIYYCVKQIWFLWQKGNTNLLIKEINSSYDFRRFSFSASQWKITIGLQDHWKIENDVERCYNNWQQRDSLVPCLFFLSWIPISRDLKCLNWWISFAIRYFVFIVIFF